MIDWTKAHENKLKALQAAGLNDDGKGNVKAPKKVMEPLAQENAPLVDEGLQYLNQAVANRPNYDDAMAVPEPDLPQQGRRGLRQHRGGEPGSGDGAGLDARRRWAPARPTKQKKNAGPGGITMDSNGNMK